MDFDDLTFNFYKLVKKNDYALQSIVTDYPLMIVDEFQDTTDIQWKVMKMLIKNGIRFLGAGDPYQTLYRFGGADHERFNQLKSVPGCKEFKLTKNFRSTRQIVSMSNAIRSQLPGYKNYKIWSESVGPIPQVILSHRKGLLIDSILQKIYYHWKENIKLKEMAVTYRFDEDARQLRRKLIDGKIPFVNYSKNDSVSNFDVFVFSNLKIAEQQGERNHWRKIIQWFQGIGKKNINTVLDLLRKENYQFENLKYLRGRRYKTDFNKLLKLLREMQKIKNNPLLSLFEIRNFYSSLEKTKGVKDHDPYWATILKISQKCTDIQELLLKYHDKSYGVYYPSNRVTEDDEFLTLSNIHKIKGKEFKVVFIIGSYDTMFENHEIFEKKEAIKDEIMIMDTAVTRSKCYLYFLFPMTKKEWNDRNHEKNPSIFVRQCSGSLYESFSARKD
jgi:DNA helicase-2/ATP-dependent DNA helicase PcrA